MKSFLFLLVLAMLAPATAARAQILLIGVQFQGGGAALSSSDTAGVISQSNFNVITGNNATDAPLLDASGTLTAVTLTLASSDFFSTGTGTGNPNATLLSGKIGAGYGSSASFTLNNLAAGTYNLIVYTENNNDGQVGTYSVTGLSTVYSTANQNGADFADTSFVPGTNTTTTVDAARADVANYLEFENVTVDSSGTLTLTAAQMSGAFSGVGGADFSGFQLQAVSVPEPASYALLGFALVLLMTVQSVRRVKLIRF